MLAQSMRIGKKNLTGNLSLRFLRVILIGTMNIKEAIRSVPAKPGIIIVLSATLLFGGWHTHARWQACEQRAKAAQHLHAALDAAASTGAKEVALSEVFPFHWEKVLITLDYHPGRDSLSCSFAWLEGSHWSFAERQEMARQGQLSALSFFVQGKPVAFVEYRNEWEKFQVDSEPISREQARLRLKAPKPNG